MRIQLLILLLAAAPAACVKTEPQQPMTLNALIDDSCAQNPAHFLQEELSAQQQLYIFGPEDSAFRNQWHALQQNYYDSGRDLSGAEKLAFASRYMPRFVHACQQFFTQAAEQCARYAVGSREMKRCLAPHNAGFRRYLAQSLKTDARGFIDLESLPQSNPKP